MRVGKAVSAGLGLLAFTGGPVLAESINVQFQGSNGTAIPANSTLTGVYPVAGSNFNVVPGSLGASGSLSVTSDTGDSTTLTFSSANLYGTGGGGTNNADLVSGYLDNNNATAATASLTLPAGIAGTGSTPYNVIVYIAGDTPGRGGTSTVNGTTVTLVEGAANGGSFTAATPATASDGTGGTQGNFYEFTGITGTTLSISNLGAFGNTAAGDNTPRLPLNGFQVFSTPEPASLGLAALGALGLLARRRNRR